MAENNDKGKILEEVVSMLYSQNQFYVERNKFFKPLNKNTRKRELDVLLTKKIDDIDIYIPIECKNHKNKISISEIDSFYGKLVYLGLDVSKAIFISVNGFTSGAREAAKSFGIKTLTFKGLTKDRMSLSIFNAIQSLNYVFPIFKSYSLISSINSTNHDHLVFYDSKKNLRGTLIDIIYEFWITNKIELTLGLQKFNLSNANELYCIQNNKLEQCISIEFEVLVVSCIINLEGKMTRKTLFDNEKIDKLNVNAVFNDKEKLSYIFFDSEELLKEYKNSKKAELKIDFKKVKLPKIRMNKMFFPLSKKVLKECDKFSLNENKDEFNKKISLLEENIFDSMWS